LEGCAISQYFKSIKKPELFLNGDGAINGINQEIKALEKKSKLR